MIKCVLFGVLVLLVAGCGDNEDSETTTGGDGKPDAPLTNTRWVLKELGGDVVRPREGQREPFIQFGHEDATRVHGYAGCNNFNGSFESNGESMTFGPIAATRMACPDMDGETRFMEMLDAVDGFDVRGDVLYLLAGGKKLARFEAWYE